MDTIPITAPPRRSLTEAAFRAEATARFGPDPRAWAFECPSCGDVATAADFPAGLGERAGAECVGRHVTGRGCRRTAFGLIPGPWLLMLADGSVVGSFPLADALSGPLRAAREIAGTGGPERAENPPAPVLAPACALSVERRDREEWMREAVRGAGVRAAWNYRVRLGGEKALLGYWGTGNMLLITYVRTDADEPWTNRPCEFELAAIDPARWAVIDQIPTQEIAAAVTLIGDAHAADIEAIPVQAWGFWSQENGRLELVGVVEGHYAVPNDAVYGLASNERTHWLGGPGTCELLGPERAAILRAWLDDTLPVAEREAARYRVPSDFAEPVAAAPDAPEPRPYWTAEEGWTDSIGCSCHISAPCSRCEQLRECELCNRAVSVPECDMDAHQAEVHGESGAGAENEA